MHPDRSSASKAEYRIKQLSAAEKHQYALGLSMPDLMTGKKSD